MLNDAKKMLDLTLRPFASLLGRASAKDIERLLAVVERLAPESSERAIITGIRDEWRRDGPGARLIRRAFTQTDRGSRTRIIYNLMRLGPWSASAARRRAFYEQEGFWPPVTILVSPTMRCNLSCVGCYAGSYSRKDDLPTPVLRRLLDECDEIGIQAITVLGGEPFLREDLWDVFEEYPDMLFQVFTNGTLIDAATARRVVECGNVVPMVSVEGLEAQTDERRGTGTFVRVDQAMDHLREAGAIFGFSAMLTRQNVDTVISERFNAHLIEKGCLFGWHFLYMPVGRKPDADLMPTPEQRETLRRRGASRIRTTMPLFVMDFFNDAPSVGGCIAAGRSYAHVTSNGDVEPCIFCHFATDNIKDTSLRKALASPYFCDIRSRQPYHPNLLRPCMLIDHPEVFREVHAAHHPRPTHKGAESLVTDLADRMDAYAASVAPVLDRAWRADFLGPGLDLVG